MAAALEVRDRAAGRVRLQLVPDASASSRTCFVAATVEPGALLVTDGRRADTSLRGMDYCHCSKPQSDPAQVATLRPCVHRVFGHLQTWLRGTHPGVGHHHLQVYLDEFTVRFNRRRTPMAAFQTPLELGTQHPPTTYN